MNNKYLQLNFVGLGQKQIDSYVLTIAYRFSSLYRRLILKGKASFSFHLKSLRALIGRYGPGVYQEGFDE